MEAVCYKTQQLIYGITQTAVVSEKALKVIFPSILLSRHARNFMRLERNYGNFTAKSCYFQNLYIGTNCKNEYTFQKR